MAEARKPVSRKRTASPERAALMREVLGLIGERWTLLVVNALVEHDTMRFSRLHEAVGQVSQKMLTKTLRRLERDGLVERTVHPTVPPHVDYELTKLGRSLGEAVCEIWQWVDKHTDDVVRARSRFDTKR